MKKRRYNKLGEVLRKQRNDVLHLSLNAVAAQVGVSAAALHYIETGQVADPSFSTMANIARVYRLSLDELAQHVMSSYVG